MVKGLFCHYLPIYRDKNGVYCSTTLTDDLFKRYFCVVDELLVATRVYPMDKTYEEAHQEKISLDNVKILEFPNLSTPKGMLTELGKSKKKLLDAMRGVDLVFIRGGVISILAADAAKKLKKPYLSECSGCAWDEYWNYSLSGKLLAPYMEYRARQITRDASHVVYVTEKWLQNRYPTKGVSTHASNVILEGIDETALTRRQEKIQGYEKPKKQFVVGTTGGVGNKAKGQQFVIQAMHALKDEYDIRYELVGGGSNEYLKEVARANGMEEKVVFKGQLTHEEVLAWLDSIDLYIQPSMQEGLPRALIEAMSRACPAIGSTTAGIPELLEDAMVFERGKVQKLIALLRRVLGQDMNAHALHNFQKAKEYEITLLNERREKIYQDYRQYVLNHK